MKLVISILGAAGLIFGQDMGRGPGEGRGPGRGQQPGAYMRGMPILAALDTNHDAVISADEIAGAPASLRKLDKNGDGQLTEDEIRPPDRGPDPSDQIVQSLMAYDKDKDGRIAKNEMPERMQGLFQRGDTNKDGYLSADEIRVLAKAQASQAAADDPPENPGPPRQDMVTAALDTNHDRTISADEIANAAASLKTLDKNGDGQLTEDEVRPAPGPGRGRGGPDGGGNPEDQINRLFTQLDKNNDGKISRDEAAGSPLEALFPRADQNKDGFITRDELRTALMQRGGPNQPPQLQ